MGSRRFLPALIFSLYKDATDTRVRSCPCGIPAGSFLGVFVSLRIRPLNQDEFAHFGDVIEHRGDHRRHPLTIDYCEAYDDMRYGCWVSKLQSPVSDFALITRFERHPYSDQAFVPLGDVKFLVVVCPDRPDGSPDSASLSAFVAGPGQGVIYRRNAWHAPLAALSAPAEFFVTMGVTEKGSNDEFFELAAPIRLELPEDGQ